MQGQPATSVQDASPSAEKFVSFLLQTIGYGLITNFYQPGNSTVRKPKDNHDPFSLPPFQPTPVIHPAKEVSAERSPRSPTSGTSLSAPLSPESAECASLPPTMDSFTAFSLPVDESEEMKPLTLQPVEETPIDFSGYDALPFLVFLYFWSQILSCFSNSYNGDYFIRYRVFLVH